MIKRLFARLRTVRRETIVVALLIVSFFAAPTFLRMLDPTTASLDGGYIHVIILGVVKIFVALLVYGVSLVIAFRSFYHYATKKVVTIKRDGKDVLVTQFRADWLNMSDPAACRRVNVFVTHSVVLVGFILYSIS